MIDIAIFTLNRRDYSVGRLHALKCVLIMGFFFQNQSQFNFCHKNYNRSIGKGNEAMDNENINDDWMRGCAAGISAYEHWLFSELAMDGILNSDFTGAEILEPKKSENVRRSLLRIIRKIGSERAAAAWSIRKGKD